MKEKVKLAEENNAIERRYRYISEVAKREFGITPPNKRKSRHDCPNSDNYKDGKVAQKSFDWCMQSSNDCGDDEEDFSETIKQDPVKQEIALEWRASELIDPKRLGLRRPIKRLNRPRPKTAPIKKGADSPQSAIHCSEPQIKEELCEDRIQLATPNSSPECDPTNQTKEALEIVCPIEDRSTLIEKGVKIEDQRTHFYGRIYSVSDIDSEEDDPDINFSQNGHRKRLQPPEGIYNEKQRRIENEAGF